VCPDKKRTPCHTEGQPLEDRGGDGVYAARRDALGVCVCECVCV